MTYFLVLLSNARGDSASYDLRESCRAVNPKGLRSLELRESRGRDEASVRIDFEASIARIRDRAIITLHRKNPSPSIIMSVQFCVWITDPTREHLLHCGDFRTGTDLNCRSVRQFPSSSFDLGL